MTGRDIKTNTVTISATGPPVVAGIVPAANVALPATMVLASVAGIVPAAGADPEKNLQGSNH